MTLDQWLKTPNPDGTSKSRGDFARQIGVTPQMISLYCKEDEPAIPSKETLLNIARVTEYAVTANDFIHGEVAQ